MNEVLVVILSMSLSGGIVIIMLYLVLLLFGKKLCRQWQYYIWLIAIIRLLLPFAPQQNLMNALFQSVKPSISSIENSSIEESQNEQTPTKDFKTNTILLENVEDERSNIQSSGTNFALTDETMDKIYDEELTGKPYVLLNVVRQYLWLIWLLPAVILFARKVITYKKYLKYIRAGSQEVQDIVLMEEFDKLLEKNFENKFSNHADAGRNASHSTNHVKNRIKLSVNSAIMSPIMVGLFNPCIILSTTQMTVLEFRHTISHELVHYRRRDILYKWLTQLVVCIHWFNPLLYMMERSINRACELSCDEVVIWDLDEQERYAYGDTLLRAAGRNVKRKLPVSPISFGDSKIKLKERLDAIMNFKKISKITYITMFSLAIILFVCSSYVGVYVAAKRNAAATDTLKTDTLKTDTPKTDTSKTKTSTSNSAQAPHSVLYRNGEYFILFDNAGEDDIPGSTGPDYGITFGAVWPDAYVSFNSYFINKKLSSKIKKDCKYFQNKGWLTKKEANAIIDVALKVQKGDTNSFKTDKQEEEYANWNITKKDGVYYYKNERIRTLMDTRKDHSFKNFSYDNEGKVDIKVIRNSNNKITKVKYLSKKKAQEILDDLQ